MLNLKKISSNDASEYSCNAGQGAMASKTIGGLEVQGKQRLTGGEGGTRGGGGGRTRGGGGGGGETGAGGGCFVGCFV